MGCILFIPINNLESLCGRSYVSHRYWVDFATSSVFFAMLSASTLNRAVGDKDSYKYYYIGVCKHVQKTISVGWSLVPSGWSGSDQNMLSDF